MRLNHKSIIKYICNKYDYTIKKDWKFTRFYHSDHIHNNIWFIEQIPAWKYLKTVYIQFFDYRDNDKNIQIENEILELYKKQRAWLPVERAGATQEINTIF